MAELAAPGKSYGRWHYSLAFNLWSFTRELQEAEGGLTCEDVGRLVGDSSRWKVLKGTAT